MNAEPTKELLRLRDVMEWLGLSKDQAVRLRRKGVLVAVVLVAGGWSFYRREDVRAAVSQGRMRGGGVAEAGQLSGAEKNSTDGEKKVAASVTFP